jgi:hypothetical protein
MSLCYVRLSDSRLLDLEKQRYISPTGQVCLFSSALAVTTICIAPHSIPPPKPLSASLSSMAMTVAMVVVAVEKALFPPVEEGGIGLQVEVRQPWVFELAVMQRLFLIVVLLPSDKRRSAGSRHYTQIARHSVPSCRVTSRLCMRVISRHSWLDHTHCSILGDAGGGGKKKRARDSPNHQKHPVEPASPSC